MTEYMNLELLAGLTPELVGVALLLLLGITQILLSFRAARDARIALRRITSPSERDARARKMRRHVSGFRVLALLSFLVAALTIAIPLCMIGLYGL
jgi:hypothetical protein